MANDENSPKTKWKKIAEEAENEINTSDTDAEEVTGEDILQQQEDEFESALEHPSYRALEDKLTVAEQKAHENWDKAVRATAELDNVRRRAERDVENAYRYSIEKFVTELLPVLDSLEQAMQHNRGKNDDDGVELTLKLLLDALKKFSVEQIDPTGQPFEPGPHEAITMQADDTVEPNTVITVFQKGYLLHDRVLRPARVIVAKAAEDKS